MCKFDLIRETSYSDKRVRANRSNETDSDVFGFWSEQSYRFIFSVAYFANGCTDYLPTVILLTGWITWYVGGEIRIIHFID